MAKFRIRAPRFIDGVYIHADAEHPVVVDLAEGVRPGLGMQPVEAPPPPPLKSHFNDPKAGHVHTPSVPSAVEHSKAKGKRGSDTDVL